MRASRLLSILITLQVQGRVTARALAARFEVSPRTIYRDVEELSASGVPIYAERGPGGGLRLLDGYQTRLTGLTAAESEALLLLGLSGPAAELGLGEPVAAARLKLLAALPRGATDGARRIADRFHLDPADWYRRPRAPAHLAAIAQAVWQARRIAVAYESWSARVRRRLDPLGLVLKAGAWYLVARCAGSLRTYAVTKIEHVEPLDEAFDWPPDFDLARHWQDAVRRFEESLRRETATLRVAPSAHSRLDRLGADVAEAVLAAAPDADGRRTAVVPIESVAHAAGLLLGFADEIEVLAPPALRARLALLAGRVAALYRDAAPAG
jgi:predicted DNA-binding transcriptional regulator YafY